MREDLVKNISAHASVIASISTEELLSHDRDAAEKTVRSLASIDSIEFAGILDSRGNDFALYVRPGIKMSSHHHHPGGSKYHIHTGEYIEIMIPVLFKQEHIGMIHVRSSMAPVYEQLKWNILITSLSALGAFLIALGMLLLLMPTVITPLKDLVALMKRVSDNNDFTLRSKLSGSDELGALSTGFNAMLEQIQTRDNTLLYQQEHLEQEVVLRTARLTEAQRIAHIGNWEWDIVNDTLSWSDEIYLIFGLTPQQFGATYDAFLNVVHPEDRKLVDTHVRQALIDGKSYSIDHRILLPDGSLRYVHEQAEVLQGEDGQAINMQGTVQDITERKTSEEELKNSNEQLSILLNSLPIAVYRCWTEDFVVIYMSNNVVNFTGYEPEEFIKNKDLWFTHIHPDDVAKVSAEMAILFEKGMHAYEYRWLKPDGTYIWIQDSMKIIQTNDGTPTYMVGMWQDISQRKQMEVTLMESEQRFRNLAELTTDWVWQVDEHGTYVYSGEKVYTLLGYTPEEIYGKTPFDFMPPEEAARVAEIFKNILSTQSPFSFLENINLHKDGHTVVLETSGVPLFSSDGIFQGYFGTEHDITQRKRAEEEINLLATTDTLTGTANRREFNTQLEKELERAKRYDTPLSLVMYDIDHFKQVNDTFGHDAGDSVLQTLTAVVKSNVRAVDTVARWGGEEFMILMPQSDGTAASVAAEKLRQEISRHPFEQIGNLTVSFGVTEFTPHDNVNAFLKRVDNALYKAKENGRNRVVMLTGNG
ncbi:MAG: PAS domain-containing protein [Sulfuricurvum sp.]|jgi:diguanylate cyclase (GGDEF)-like protein/PAS domain S-box-containing protein